MLKKLVCAALVVALVVCSAISTFAASYDISTSYVTGQEGKIQVTSYVTDVAAGDTLTYLAYKNNDATVAENIVYIDQAITTGTSHTFTYKTSVANVGSKVLHGGKNIAVDSSIVIPGLDPVGCTVTVKTSAEDAGSSVLTDVTGVSGYSLVAFAIGTGKKISEVYVDETLIADTKWFAAANGFWLDNSYLQGATQTVRLVLADVAGEKVAQTKKYGFIASVADSDEAMMVIGGVNFDAAEYGILISTSANAEDTLVAAGALDGTSNDISANVVKFTALGKGSDDTFAIKLTTAANDGFASGDYYARVYAFDGVNYHYGKVVTITK